MSDLPVLTSTHELFIVLSHPVLLRRERDRAAGWAPDWQPRSTHHVQWHHKAMFAGTSYGMDRKLVCRTRNFSEHLYLAVQVLFP